MEKKRLKLDDPEKKNPLIDFITKINYDGKTLISYTLISGVLLDWKLIKQFQNYCFQNFQSNKELFIHFYLNNKLINIDVTKNYIDNTIKFPEITVDIPFISENISELHKEDWKSAFHSLKNNINNDVKFPTCTTLSRNKKNVITSSTTSVWCNELETIMMYKNEKGEDVINNCTILLGENKNSIQIILDVIQ